MDPQVQEQPAQPQAPAQQQPQQEVDMSPEAIMARALGPQVQRDDKGRFVAQKEAAADPAAQPAADPAAQPAAEVAADPAAEVAAADQEEVKWDEVKGVKLKIPMKNGDKEWVEEKTIEELRNERLMHADYMARRRELDTERATHEQNAKQAIEKERHTYLSALDTLQQSIMQAASPELANVDWGKLAAENPAEYVRLSNRAREVNEALQRVQFEQEKVQTQQAKDRDERLAKAVIESKVKLKEAIPAWDDALYQTLQKRSVDSYGFKPEEVSKVWDHRIWQIVHDAHQYRAMTEGKTMAEKKVVEVPKVLKPGSVKPKVDTKVQELTQAKSRLQANGNDIEAAASLMGTLLTKR